MSDIDKNVKEDVVVGNFPLNYVALCGDVVDNPVFHHKTHDESIYRFFVSVPRLNKEVTDIIPIEISDRVIDLTKIVKGNKIGIEGQYRSFNQPNENGKVSLKLFVFVKDVTFMQVEGFSQNDYANYVRLVGFLCKKPVYRRTPSGREISDVILAVNRIYGRSDYIPCITWGRNARYVSSNLNVGDRIEVEGRLQSRKYYKKLETGIEEHTVYEVSTYKVVKVENEGV